MELDQHDKNEYKGDNLIQSTIPKIYTLTIKIKLI